MADWRIKFEGHIASVSHKFPESNFIPLKSRRNFPLSTYRFHHEDPRALIFLFHGMHLASSDFSHLAHTFYKQHFTVAAFDQEGHGNSGGEKGTINSLEDYSEACVSFVKLTKSLYPPNTPVFLLGLSMGGTLCVMTSLKIPDEIRGVILFAPALGFRMKNQTLIQKSLSFLNNCCCRNIKLKPIDQKTVSRNEYYKEYFNENPDFFSGKLNVRTLAAMFSGVEQVRNGFGRFVNSVLVFHGEKDVVTSCEESRNFIDRCGSVDKEIVVYPNMKHVLTHEPEYDEIVAKCVDWIMYRL